MTALRARVVGDGVADLGSLGPAWRELDRHSAPNVFLTFEWVSSWWHSLAGRHTPNVVVVEDERGAIVGIAPLLRSLARVSGLGTATTLQFMGHPQADRLGFLARSGHEADVADAVASSLRERTDWDVLRLSDLPSGSPELASLTRAFRGDHIVLVEPGLACPYLPIEGTWDAYLRTRQKRFRVGLRHDQRRVREELAGQMTACLDPEHAKRALEFMFEHNAARFAVGDTTLSGFADPRVRAFHLELAPRMLEERRLDLSVIELDGTIVAVDYGFRHGGKIWGYNAAFDARYEPYGLGRVLLGWVIERAFSEGVDEYDFLLGDYAYKRRWAAQTRHHREVLVVRRRPPAIVKAALPAWWNRLKHAVKRAVPQEVMNTVRRRLLHRKG